MSCDRLPWLRIVAPALAALALGGCGLSAGSGSGKQAPHVAISLTAPMTGATVGVDRIQVTGTVTPANATVQVGGLPATVRRAGFVRALALHTATTTIPVTANAPGWAPATVTVTVHYSRTLAKTLNAARSAALLAAAPPPAPRQPTRAHGGSSYVPSVDLTGGGGNSPPSGAGTPTGGTPTGTPTGGTPTGTPGGTPTGTPTGGTPTGTPTGGT
ncbi:MAG: hypothetical protein ACRDMJ_05540, partial [Solirubrobacteraceae bacterium]